MSEKEISAEDQAAVDALVDEVNGHIQFISASHKGMAVTSTEVLANTVYWGGLLTRYYPDMTDIASVLMAKLQVRGELVEHGDDRVKGN